MDLEITDNESIYLKTINATILKIAPRNVDRVHINDSETTRVYKWKMNF